MRYQGKQSSANKKSHKSSSMSDKTLDLFLHLKTCITVHSSTVYIWLKLYTAPILINVVTNHSTLFCFVHYFHTIFKSLNSQPNDCQPLKGLSLVRVSQRLHLNNNTIHYEDLCRYLSFFTLLLSLSYFLLRHYSRSQLQQSMEQGVVVYNLVLAGVAQTGEGGIQMVSINAQNLGVWRLKKPLFGVWEVAEESVASPR